MSTSDAVNDLRRQGLLHRLQPTGFLAGTELRTLCLSNDLNDYFFGPPQDHAHRHFQMRVAPHLVAFIQEELITVRVGTPKKGEATQIARLNRAVWELRCVDTGPPIRVLGCFAEKNLLVALSWEYRQPLGKYGSPKWRAAIARCEATWQGLLPQHPPTTEGVKPDDYLSGAVPR